MQVSVRSDMKAINRLIDGSVKAAPRLAVRALNRGAASGRTVSVRMISKHIGLKQKLIRDRIEIKKATRATLTAVIFANRDGFTGIPLIWYVAQSKRHPGAFLKKTGVRYRIGGKYRTLPGSFVAEMRSGHIGVFVRTGKGRLPIIEKATPSVRRVFDRREVQLSVKRKAQDVFVKEYDRLIQRELDRLERKGT